MKPKGNGLVELVDEKHNDNSFFCMKLVELLEQTDYDTWMKAFADARSGRCPLKKKCDKYQKSIIKKRKTRIKKYLYEQKRTYTQDKEPVR